MRETTGPILGRHPMTSADYLEKFYPGGPWTLITTHPIRATVCRTREDVDRWVEENDGESNCYFQINPVFKWANRRAKAEDISALHALAVDFDASEVPDGIDPTYHLDQEVQAFRKRIAKMDPLPSVVVSSGGGVQAFWLLETDLSLDGTEDMAREASRYGEHLVRQHGGDGVFDLPRMMRLPGTMNLPDEKKLAKGRIPARAEVLEFNENRYPLDQFTKAAPKEAAAGTVVKLELPADLPKLDHAFGLEEDYGVPDSICYMVKHGKWPPDHEKAEHREGDETGSANLWAFLNACIRHDVPHELAISVAIDPDYGVSEHAFKEGAKPGRTPRRVAERQLRRAIEKFVPDVDEAFERGGASLFGQGKIDRKPNGEADLLEMMNEKYTAIGSAGGKFRILHIVKHSGGRCQYVFQTEADFLSWFKNTKILVPTGGTKKDGTPEIKAKTIGEWWLTHPERNQKSYLTFNPSDEELPGAYNMWQGFAVTPKEGDCGLYLDHLRDVICSGNEEHYRYLIGWMARAVQRPDEQAGTCVVFQGEPGTGKSLSCSIFGKLFDEHFLHTGNPASLTGRFNAQLQDCVVLFADEANFSNPHVAHRLKTLITESTLEIERKGMALTNERNYLHIMMASNDEHVVQVDNRDRRFFILRVSNDHRQDLDYFERLVAQMETEAGQAALLHFLLNYDLSEFKHRRIPSTEVHKEHQDVSLAPEYEWWLNILERGHILDEDAGWETSTETTRLCYLSFARAVKNGNAHKLGRFLTKITKNEKKRKQVAKIRHVPNRLGTKVEEDDVNGFDATVVDERGQEIPAALARVYVLPELDRCRELWNEICGTREWPDVGHDLPPDDGDPFA